MNLLTDIPWGAIIAGIGMVVGFIIWLVRLEGRANSTARDVTRVEARADATDRDVRELQTKAITRDDLREVKFELTERIDAVGNRVAEEVKNLVAVMNKRPTSSSRTTKAGS